MGCVWRFFVGHIKCVLIIGCQSDLFSVQGKMEILLKNHCTRETNLVNKWWQSFKQISERYFQSRFNAFQFDFDKVFFVVRFLFFLLLHSIVWRVVCEWLTSNCTKAIYNWCNQKFVCQQQHSVFGVTAIDKYFGISPSLTSASILPIFSTSLCLQYRRCCCWFFFCSVTVLSFAVERKQENKLQF